MRFPNSVTRHVILALLRLLLALGIICSMPVAHMYLGDSYPGDGQQAFGFIIIFFVVSLGAAVLFVSLGSVMQVLLRNRAARHTVLVDVVLFLLLAGVLVYGGATAEYTDTSPSTVIPATSATSSAPATGSTASGAD